MLENAYNKCPDKTQAIFLVPERRSYHAMFKLMEESPHWTLTNVFNMGAPIFSRITDPDKDTSMIRSTYKSTEVILVFFLSTNPIRPHGKDLKYTEVIETCTDLMRVC